MGDLHDLPGAGHVFLIGAHGRVDHDGAESLLDGQHQLVIAFSVIQVDPHRHRGLLRHLPRRHRQILLQLGVLQAGLADGDDHRRSLGFRRFHNGDQRFQVEYIGSQNRVTTLFGVLQKLLQCNVHDSASSYFSRTLRI